MAAIDHEALLDWMEAKGWLGRQSELAAEVGISKQYLTDIVKGRRSLKRNPELIKKLAEALNVPQSRIERRVSA